MTEVMAEPPDGAVVGMFDTTERRWAGIYDRDDEQIQFYEGDEPVWLGEGGEYDWADLGRMAAAKGWQVVRLYRADAPEVADCARWRERALAAEQLAETRLNATLDVIGGCGQ
jgi:hypothetical protein